MIIHIPHSSAETPNEYRDQFVLSDQELAYELLRMTDAYTDDLFRLPYKTAIFPVSRIVLDPERFVDDAQESMSTIGMGVIYTKTHNGQDLRRAITQKEKDNLLQTFYYPHHEMLNNLVNEELRQKGTALIVDCHSFPSSPLPYEFNQEKNRPDICIGTDNFHTPESLQEKCVLLFQDKGYSVELNKPFSGSLVPGKYYQKESGVHSIMVEVNRKLYMDEGTGKKISGYYQVRSDLEYVLNRLSLHQISF